MIICDSCKKPPIGRNADREPELYRAALIKGKNKEMSPSFDIHLCSHCVSEFTKSLSRFVKGIQQSDPDGNKVPLAVQRERFNEAAEAIVAGQQVDEILATENEFDADDF